MQTELIANIKLANNGYLLTRYMTPGMLKVATEMAKEHKVVFTNGLVHLPETVPEFFKTERPTRAFALQHDGPDYEAMILDRQASDGIYD